MNFHNIRSVGSNSIYKMEGSIVNRVGTRDGTMGPIEALGRDHSRPKGV
jgi:hypothetical protein